MEFGYVYLKKDGNQYMTKETNNYLTYLENKNEQRRQEDLYWKNLDRLVKYKIRDYEEQYIDYDIEYIYDYYLNNDDEEDYEDTKKSNNSLYNSDSDYYSD